MSPVFKEKHLYKMSLEKIKGIFDRNLEICSKISLSTKRGVINPTWVPNQYFCTKRTIYTGLKATHSVEEIGRGIKKSQKPVVAGNPLRFTDVHQLKILQATFGAIGTVGCPQNSFCCSAFLKGWPRLLSATRYLP